MRTLAFDGRMGASGDMLLGALLAAGADRDALAPVEDAPSLDVIYQVRDVEKAGISATAVDVLLDGAETDGDPSDHDHHSDDHGHEHHDHTDEGTHDHSPDPEHGYGEADSLSDHEHDHDDGDHTHAEGHGPHRTYAEVVEIVDGLDLPAGVAADARAIFEILGEAEAAVHGTDLDDTHFHEVGADDAIADVVGVCLLLDDLGVDRVVTTPLSTGGGEAAMSHGTYPVPTPAVVEIAERADWAISGGPVERELLTPTGAAILAHVAEGVDRLPSLRVDASGYGAGGYDFDEHPNVLRAVVGEGDGGLQRDEITVLETNLDDAPPEVLGGLQDRLADVGARDVSIVPLTMKKSRPGHLVKVIVKPEDADRVARRLAEETGTLGVREHGAGHRWVASREVETATITVDGSEYAVDVKVASDTDGAVYDVSAEYDDALAVARETDLPVREVMRRAETETR
ncbi:TIGR00299 family protein [Halorientalis sp. IM1011]|uniref:nickel pincer cofactor biosynthesis protein LarC n=1 Tax=Halorientalis sp. IM1011 TaxID=1932360 RepID=UPI00097CC55E|nr:nickel pincer cofactor biosynthesis protein LarC [Halorientalis sp. IM1011]AQL43709.1 TIGR00299 family protein [Halorientalis sp. IM1011]